MQPATNTAPMGSPAPQLATGAAPGTPGRRKPSLYVADLSTNCTEAKLFEVFNAIGAVSSIRICRDTITRRSLGYAYVNFNSYDDAERALDTMNYMPIMEKPCRIMWSQRDSAMGKPGNIFVKNLPKDIDHKGLFETFSLFGNILSCKVALDDATGESRGYGFVQFETVEAAEEAIKMVDGMTIKNHVIVVGEFKKREARRDGGGGGGGGELKGEVGGKVSGGEKGSVPEEDKWYYQSQDGSGERIEGPYAEERLRYWHSLGYLPETLPVRKGEGGGGNEEWITLERMLGGT